MNSKIIGVVACLVIVLSAVYGAIVFARTNSFGLTAATIQSQLQDGSEIVREKKLTGSDLFGVAQQFNLKIEENASALLAKVKDAKANNKLSANLSELSVKSAIATPIVGEVKVITPEEVGVEVGAQVITEMPTELGVKKDADAEDFENNEQLKVLLAHRRGVMKELAKTDPELFLAAVMPTETKEKLSESLQTEVESTVALTGSIEVFYFDDSNDIENGHSRYFLNAGNKRYDFYPAENIEAISGDNFRVRGVLIDDVLVARRGDTERVSNGYRPRSVSSLGEQKTLFVLLSFQDSPPLEFQLTKEQVRDRLLNPDQKFQSFFSEQSYGKVSFSGDVTDWITLPRNCDARWPGLGLPSNNDELKDVLTEHNIPFNQYDRLMVILNSCGGTGYSGYSSIGPVPVTIGSVTHQMSTAWANMIPGATNDPSESYALGNFVAVVAHEMGHSLGLYHAVGLDCDRSTFGNNCITYPYGNYFDMMGGGGAGVQSAGHFNGYYKELLGWISPQNRLAITTSGRYTINSLEETYEDGGQNMAKNFAKIKNPVSNATPFYLEFRNGSGFDGALDQGQFSLNKAGLMVNYTRGDQTASLLDMQPSSAEWHIDLRDAVLTGNSTFTNPETGITIGPVVATTSNSITFDVGIVTPPCVRRAPEIGTDPERTVAAQGSNAQISFYIINTDSPSCGGSSFRFETMMTNVWRPIVEPRGDFVIQPGVVINKNINFSVPTTTPVGPYVIKNRITKTSADAISYPAEVRVVYPPIVNAVVPRAARVGTEIVLRGRNLTSAPQVYITGEDGFYYSNLSLRDDGSEYRFAMPAQIRKWGTSALTRTKPGKYTLTVLTSDDVASAPVSFEVLR